MIFGYFSIPGSLLRPTQFDSVPTVRSTVKLDGDDGPSQHIVRFVEHRFFRPDHNEAYQDQQVIIHLSEGGALA